MFSNKVSCIYAMMIFVPSLFIFHFPICSVAGGMK